jgi:two-component system response regulator FixJ
MPILSERTDTSHPVLEFAQRNKKSVRRNERTVIHVIDDDPAICDSLSLLLATEGLCVQTHASALKFLECVGSCGGGCVVMDLHMPEMSGIDLLAKMNERRLSLPTIVITGYVDFPLAIQAMRQGAVDVLEKPFDDGALLACIMQALTTERREQSSNAKAHAVLARVNSLTERESAVLSGLVMGKSNKGIAYELGVSTQTVEIHRANVMAKMKAESLRELVRMALVVAPAGPN